MAQKKTGFLGRKQGTTIFEGIVVGEVDVPSDIEFSHAAAGANVTEVTLKLVAKGGRVVPGVHVLDIYLSDAATGVGLTGTTASGTVQAKAASGTVLAAITAKKALRVSTKTDGTFILEITDAAKTGFYIAAASGIIPVQVSRQLVAGDYGA